MPINDKPELTQAEMVPLEMLVDKHGLTNVLYALGVICHEKADYIREQIPHDNDADNYDDMAIYLDDAGAKASILP